MFVFYLLCHLWPMCVGSALCVNTENFPIKFFKDVIPFEVHMTSNDLK